MKRLMVVVSVLTCVFGGSSVVMGQAQKTLHEAAASGDVAQVRQYVEKKADLNAVDRFGRTALKCAVDGYSTEAVKVLIDGGANPNVKDAEGNTPLINACKTGQKDVVEILLAAKADLAAKDSAGWTALHCAAMMGQLEIAEILIKAGANVNATNNSGQTPLSIAQQRNQTAIADLLKQHGATVPVVQDQYGIYDPGAAQASPSLGMQSQLPAGLEIDPNAIREQIRKVAGLDASLKALDANSESEQRAWITKRNDNRTILLRVVQKQFEDEMKFVKGVAAMEKAAKTAKAVDDLVAARKKRYERIGEDLRDQRRQTLQESRDTTTTGRGRGTTGRGTSRGRSTGATGQDAYGAAPQARTPRRPTNEANETPVDATTQAQSQAWLGAQPENKAELLKTTNELDMVEYAALHELATEEKAVKTDTAIMALLMLRQERIAKIEQKWIQEDERLQRMQERTGTNGTQQETQQGTRRGRR